MGQDETTLKTTPQDIMEPQAGETNTAVPKSIDKSSMIYPPDDGSEAHFLIRVARQHADDGDDESTIEVSKTAIVLAQQAGNQRLVIWAHCNISTSSAVIGLKDEALHHAMIALRLAQECKDKALESRALFSIAFVALESGDEQQAQVTLERSLECASEAGSDYDMFWALNNLSHVYAETTERLLDKDETGKEFEDVLAKTFATVNEAMEAARRTKQWSHRGYAMLNLANANLLKGDLETARALVARYSRLARLNNSSRLMCYANLDEARLLSKTQDYDAAIAILSSEAHLTELCRTDDLRLRTQEMLAKLNKEAKNFECAYAHLEEARELERKIKEFQADRHINMLTSKIEVEEARADAERLQAEAAALELRNSLLEKDRAELARNAMLDSLTNLGNRRAADLAIDRQVAAAVSSDQSFQLAMMDIDSFKGVNDRFGHAVGDKVLTSIGQILQDGLRGQDKAFRYGGEEFVILLMTPKIDQGREICERLRILINSHDWTSIAFGLVVTASFGLTRWSNEAVAAPILERADKALYRAKDGGRNQVVLS